MPDKSPSSETREQVIASETITRVRTLVGVREGYMMARVRNSDVKALLTVIEDQQRALADAERKLAMVRAALETVDAWLLLWRKPMASELGDAIARVDGWLADFLESEQMGGPVTITFRNSTHALADLDLILADAKARTEGERHMAEFLFDWVPEDAADDYQCSIPISEIRWLAAALRTSAPE